MELVRAGREQARDLTHRYVARHHRPDVRREPERTRCLDQGAAQSPIVRLAGGAVAARLGRSLLELGGNNAIIVESGAAT